MKLQFLCLDDAMERRPDEYLRLPVIKSSFLYPCVCMACTLTWFSTLQECIFVIYFDGRLQCPHCKTILTLARFDYIRFARIIRQQLDDEETNMA